MAGIKKTRLGNWGHNTRRAGDYSGKATHMAGTHPVENITRLGSAGYGVRRTHVGFGSKTDHSGGIAVVSEWIIWARHHMIR